MDNDSYEKKIQDDLKENRNLPPKIDISILKYFWQAGPYGSSKKHSIPKFLRQIDVLNSFTDNELRIFSKYLHLRNFSENEIIFKQGDLGVGFYFIYHGLVLVNIYEEDEISIDSNNALALEQYDYFGELALLQDNSIRSATVIAKEECQLLGIFKPDVEELITAHPVVATKLLQSVSVITANRLFSVTTEVKELKYKLAQLEKSHGKKHKEY